MNQINVVIGFLKNSNLGGVLLKVVFCSIQSGALLNLGGVQLKVVFYSDSGILMNTLCSRLATGLESHRCLTWKTQDSPSALIEISHSDPNLATYVNTRVVHGSILSKAHCSGASKVLG